MSLNTFYTDMQLSKIYTRAKIMQDPVNYTLKDRIISDSTLSVRMYTGTHSTLGEHLLVKKIANHLNISGFKYWCVLQDIPYDALNDEDFVDTSETEVPIGGQKPLILFKNNMYLNRTYLMYIFGRKFKMYDKGSFNLTNVGARLKTTNIVESLFKLCISLKRKDSLIHNLKYLDFEQTYDKSFEYLEKCMYVEDFLNKKSNLYPVISIHPILAMPTTPISKSINISLFDNNVRQSNGEYDTLLSYAMFHSITYSIEILYHIYNNLDEDTKEVMLNLITEPLSNSNILSNLYKVDSNCKLILNPEIENIINIHDASKRFAAIQTFLKDKDIVAKAKKAAVEYRKDNGGLNSKYAIPDFLGALTLYCDDLSMQNIRIKPILMLLNYCKLNKINLKESDEVLGDDEISEGIAALGNVLGNVNTNGTFDANNSLLDLNLFDSGTKTSTNIENNNENSNDDDVQNSKRNATLEALDRANASFKDGIYSFDVEDCINTSTTYKDTYNTIAEKVHLLNANLIKQIKDIKIYNTGGKNPGQRSGKLDRKNLHKYKTSNDIFYNNTYKIKENDLAFGIILDASGSMSGTGIENGIITMIILHETLKALGINHSIISHNSNSYHKCNIKRYQAFKEDATHTVNKNYGICNIKASSCNCDSGALYYMEKAFSRVQNRDKICLIFSDGQPTECSDTDLKDQVRRMEQKGIKVIGIGVNFNEIAEYYKDHANGKNLKDMLNIVTNILKQYVLDKKD